MIRDGKEETVEMSEIVKDDVIVLKSGDQICNDACVTEGTLEMNESLLTGESDAIVKRKGTHFTSFLIVPLGVLLFVEAMVLRNMTYQSAVVTSAAALLGMLPKGLVLLILLWIVKQMMKRQEIHA